MLICVRPGGDKFEPSQRTHDRTFAGSNPLVAAPATPASLCVVDYPLFLVA